MAFWGIEVKPGKPYVHHYDDENGRLHVSQATIVVAGSSTKRSVLQCNVGDKKPTYLCSLLPEKIETCALNLEFEEEDEVTFSVQGPHSVHLSGFFFGQEEEQHDNCCEEDDDSDSYGEDVMVSGSEDDSMEYGSEYDDEEVEFSDDDLGLYPSQVRNSGVKIEEIEDEEKPDNEVENSKQAKKKKNKSSENENSNHQIVAKGETGVPVLESEDEDGFPTSSRNKKSDASNPGSKTEEADKESLKKENNTSEGKKLKRKIDAVSQDGQPSRGIDNAHNSSAQPDIVTPVSEVKQKKNKKKKLEKEENAQQNSAPNSSATGEESAVATKDLSQTADKKKEKKKKKNKQQESVTPTTEEKVADRKGSVEKKEKEADRKGSVEKKEKVRTYPNGLMIEDVAMGKPDGKRASPGNKVSVRYIGKLQKNGKIFDSNIGGPPFKFRLGIGEVIKGWDVGVNGMRIGDKRRLTIPPAMGYGAKGARPDIPPNAWLVFDVELVGVN